MLTFFGVKVSYEALAFFILFIASEYIGLNKKLRANSVAQVIVRAARLSRPYRKEDDKLRKAFEVLRGK
jgi:hypothetical protein